MQDSQEKISPMMQQWQACKEQSGTGILLFRLGDFYEAFYNDAEVIARELELTLTKRQEVPMAGIPSHTAETYVDKLVAKGYRVAIAEQTENPKETKGLVKREVVRVITPGTVIRSSLLKENTNNFLASIHIVNTLFGLCLLDITTGECRASEFDSLSELSNEIIATGPKELLLSEKDFALYKDRWTGLQKEIGCMITIREEKHFDHAVSCERLKRRFPDALPIAGKISAINAAGALFQYVSEELHLGITHIKTVKNESRSGYMRLDASALKHLEISESSDKTSTLLYLLDKTKTASGGRLMRSIISKPLLSVSAIRDRQDAVEFFLGSSFSRELGKKLSEIRDLERLIMRIETGFANPKDLLALRLSLEVLPAIGALLTGDLPPLLSHCRSALFDPSVPVRKLQETLEEDPPVKLSEGNVIKKGIDPELDELKELCRDTQTWIAEYQTVLRESTGIKTLKIGYTKAFGYYIEVSRGQAVNMPPSFERKQTLVNAERFITPELKEYEYKVLSAEERIAALEAIAFRELCKAIASHADEIRKAADAVAQIDCFSALAETAMEYNYVRPVVDEGNIFCVEEGRHPVIEAKLRSGDCIPNDIYLDNADRRLCVITGPNMAGKSTFIRQTALIAILAQIGSFIPAKNARIGIIDKVFTRIGAGDNLSKGQSTFMVEMTEAADILHNVTDRSLVILDELGRGTGTYDGISLAKAIAEYLLLTDGKRAKTLFATHYHELTELEATVPGAINYNVAVKETDSGIVFLHKIVRGGTDKSYGIHVAKLAGLPPFVIKRAEEILKVLEKQIPKKSKAPKEEQLSFFSLPPENPIVSEIRKIDPDHLTPMQALQQLLEWKSRIGK